MWLTMLALEKYYALGELDESEGKAVKSALNKIDTTHSS